MTRRPYADTDVGSVRVCDTRVLLADSRSTSNLWLKPRVQWHNRRYVQKNICILLNVSQIFRWLGDVHARATGGKSGNETERPLKTLVWTFRSKENARLFSIAPVFKDAARWKNLCFHPWWPLQQRQGSEMHSFMYNTVFNYSIYRFGLHLICFLFLILNFLVYCWIWGCDSSAYEVYSLLGCNAV